MFTGKKRKKFMADLNLINKKLEEKTPIYMRTNGITIFNKNVSVLFKMTSQNGVVRRYSKIRRHKQRSN